MTEQESKALELSADLWNALIDLPIIHPADINEACFHIHALQNMIMARQYQIEMLPQQSKTFQEKLQEMAEKRKNAPPPPEPPPGRIMKEGYPPTVPTTGERLKL
jgi:hypothetical protein